MQITYKYKIGQKVRLTSNSSLNQYRENQLKPLVNTDVTIFDRGFEILECRGYYSKPNYQDKYFIRVFYYIDEDPITKSEFNYERTRIPEVCLEGEEMNEVVDEKFFSADDVELILGKTKVYTRVLDKNRETGEIYANCQFSFASYGLVTGFRKNYTLNTRPIFIEENKPNQEVQTRREFLCFYEPENGKPSRPRLDSAREGNESWESIRTNKSQTIFVNIPENYPEIFTNSALNKDWFYNIWPAQRKNPFDNWERCQWLEQMGMLEKTKEQYFSVYCKKHKKEYDAYVNKKEKDKKEKDKLDKILSGLTEEEKEKLKKMLS